MLSIFYYSPTYAFVLSISGYAEKKFTKKIATDGENNQR